MNQTRSEQYSNQNAGMHYSGRSDAAANNVSAANAPDKTSQSGPSKSAEEEKPTLPPRPDSAEKRDVQDLQVDNLEASRFEDSSTFPTSSVPGSVGFGSSSYDAVLSAHSTGVRDDGGYSEAGRSRNSSGR